MRCYGVSNSSPEKVLEFLVTKNIVATAAAVSIVRVGVKLALKPPKRRVLFVVQISDLFRNLEVLNSEFYADTQVFVFASPLRINELAGCTPLDMTPSVSSKGVGFNLLPTLSLAKYKAALRLPPVETKRATAQYLTILTDNVKHGSLLTPLMTFIYTLPKATHQTPVKEAVAKYFHGISLETVESVLAKLLSEKNLVKIRAVLESEISSSYRSAMKELKAKDSSSLTSICTKWGTSDYEIRYLQSIIASMQGRKHLRGKSLADIQKAGLRPHSARNKPKSAGVQQ